MTDLKALGQVRDYADAGLILLAFALFATDNLVHYPLALMALLGLWFAMREPRALRRPAVQTLLLLFGLVWLPMLISVFDSVSPARSLKTAVAYLHLLPAAYYLLLVCARPAVFHLVTAGVVLLLLFAGFDAFCQIIWREDLFGYPYDGNILMGLFDPKQRLGLFLGAFAPLYIEVVRRWSMKFPALWLVLIPMVIVLMMTLKRSGWVMLVVGVGGYFALRRGAGSRLGPDVMKVCVVLAIVVATATFNTSVREHVVRTAGLLSSDIAEIDLATGHRVTLWRTGYRMFRAHWLNGVGVRGYRVSYADFAAADDFWIARGLRGQTHAHMMAVEVAAESGLIGVTGLLAFGCVLFRALLRARNGPGAAVWLLCALVAWLPLNTHLAFYGSYWATLLWLLTAIGLAATQPVVEEAPKAA
jgi:O-antigen ligase